MKDRQPTYPGRVKLVPVTGQENTFDMVRADGATEEGTPLNKATLLKDETAALYGLDDAATVDEVLSKFHFDVLSPDRGGTGYTSISDLVSALFESYKMAKVEYGSYKGTGGTSGSSNKNSLTFSFPPKMLIIQRGTSGAFASSSSKDWGKQCMILTRGVGAFYISGNTYYNIIRWSGNTVTWYLSFEDTNTISLQLNESGATYYYIAIG